MGPNSNSPLGQPRPVTPSGDRPDPAKAIVEELNRKYNLNILLPNDSLSPTVKRQLSTRDRRHETICSRLRYLHWSRTGELRNVLADFDKEARNAYSRWARKPGADAGLLPSSPDSPWATTPVEQSELRSRLSELLEAARPVERVAPRLFGRSQSATEAAGLVSAASSEELDSEFPPPAAPGLPRRSKRRSEDGHENAPAKKSSRRGDGFKHVDRTLDDVPVRSKANDERPAVRSKPGDELMMPAPVLPPAVTRSIGLARTQSAHSSVAYGVSVAPTIFSPPGDEDVPMATQSTVEASTQEKKRLAMITHSSSQDSFPVSSGHVEALYNSFRAAEEELLDRQTRADVASGTWHPSAAPARDETRLPETGHHEDPAVDASSLLSFEDSVLQGGSALPAGRLAGIWPTLPHWLHPAPFPVAWEVTRIALHCGVDLDSFALNYSTEWVADNSELRKAMWKHHAFAGRAFPERPSQRAWEIALGGRKNPDQDVVFQSALEFSNKDQGPLYKLKLHPPRIDRPTRLSRRFGADRFMEMLVPSHTTSHAAVPRFLRDNEEAVNELNRWFFHRRHRLAGREWAVFFVKDGGYKKPAQDPRIGPDPDSISKERLFLFAEDGQGPLDIQPGGRIPTRKMLDWLLQLRKNAHQPYLKLFSRTALGLSRTSPVLVFEPHQIRHVEQDLLSPTGKVMNDGVGQMSLSVARKIRDILGFQNIPSAVQGRLGSAKGMWIINVTDTGEEDWIETYPSQRKWKCDETDAEHRTLEIRGHAAEVKSSHLNFQFLPVLEDRAKNKKELRLSIADLLRTSLRDDIDSQKKAIADPLTFLQWVADHAASRHERVINGEVQFLGGLPNRDEEVLTFLLAGGFDVLKQKFMQEIAFRLQQQKCERLKEKLNVRVGRSAYMYMVVDFLGVLKEDEVHIGFSSRFRANEFPETMVHGIDVLVARSPAHYVSDIQRVKAVFKPELGALKDVVVFPTTGNVALADKLSGGDYDGDMAWVCWDDRIVKHFVNAEVPEIPDLVDLGYLGKVKGSLADLIKAEGSRSRGIKRMLEESLAFNTRRSMLGICTNFKEKLCYNRGNVNDSTAVLLSTLLSNLVDQAKQGIQFGQRHWAKLRREQCRGSEGMQDPGYKSSFATGGPFPHIIDHLKFDIAQKLIDAELAALHRALDPTAAKDKSPSKYSLTQEGGQGAQLWDPVLARPYNDYRASASGQAPLEDHGTQNVAFRPPPAVGARGLKPSGTRTALLDALLHDIDQVFKRWQACPKDGREGMPFPDKIQHVYDEWCAIQPRVGAHKALPGSHTVESLLESHVADPENTRWAELRASATFKCYYHRNPTFVWRMAGRQLQAIKGRSQQGPLTLMTKSMYASSKHDPRFIKQIMAMKEDQASQYVEELDGLDEMGEFIEDDV